MKKTNCFFVLIHLLCIHSSAQTVTTFAGSGATGSLDTTGIYATFNFPVGLCANASGDIFVADYFNNKIRQITPVGMVTTFVGSNTSGAIDSTGIYAKFFAIEGVCIDATGNIFVADKGNHKIRKVTPSGVVTTIAGSGFWGSTDGIGTAASFATPVAVCSDNAGNIYVADYFNSNIRKITSAGVVTTFAGSTSASCGLTDATGTLALFCNPSGLCCDASGNIYVADSGNNKIRKITPAGVVTSIAGSTSGIAGSADGIGAAASFYSPLDVCIDAIGNIYVADFNNNKIRKITPSGIVTTYAGSGVSGSTDGVGIAASFSAPDGICSDLLGNIYVAERTFKKVRKITPPPAAIYENASNNLVTVFPNPSTGKFLFSNLENESTIEIFDALGKSVLKTTSYNNSCSIDLTGKAKGIYYFNIIDKNKNVQEGKIVVQ